MDSALSAATMSNWFGLCRIHSDGLPRTRTPNDLSEAVGRCPAQIWVLSPGSDISEWQVIWPVLFREHGSFHTPVLQEDTNRRWQYTTHASCQGPFGDRCDPPSRRHRSAPGTWPFTVPSLKLLHPAPKRTTGLYYPTLIATQFRILFMEMITSLADCYYGQVSGNSTFQVQSWFFFSLKEKVLYKFTLDFQYHFKFFPALSVFCVWFSKHVT